MRKCFTKGLHITLILTFFILGCNQLKDDWEKAKQSHSVPEIQKFLSENPDSKFSKEAKCLLDSLDCKKANCVIIFSKGIGVTFGKETAPFGSAGITLTLEGSSFITSVLIDDQTEPSSKYSGLIGTPVPMEPAIYIWRNFSEKEMEIANKNALKTGFAYLKVSTLKYRVVRIIDLKKSDKEICKEFGVDASESGNQQKHSN